MLIEDRARAERKIAQVGYYRLSGFWHPCRAFEKGPDGKFIPSMPGSKVMKRSEEFLPGTTFNKVFCLYLFDKRLRLLMLDAIERIEIHLRSVIAHEMGYHSPTAYDDHTFINQKFLRNTAWNNWKSKHQDNIERCREDHIIWHKESGKAIPIWVAIEAWDFGIMSKYFSMLLARYQNRICQRIDPSLRPNILNNWLRELNTIRNRCAHHTRIWNQSTHSPLLTPADDYFKTLSLGDKALTRALGIIAITWFLVRKIGVNSQWITCVADNFKTMPRLPNCNLKVMGFENDEEFPLEKFQ
ncbi:Abi family protein [Nitratidesulfovibrio sp. SRB-5]|uniref:Abi family protein n=1 Tax=Nitratidesulfovibrio sp. SRB-5 TaxID=2872636 RepID=UPI001CBA6312|nr:Abi family protein [Nitratidesulfovibrio sp. SRB-5]MBZ2172195.1 Abi family protein [Nitratidesulfovibrio sp. SRB-5]